MTVSSAVKSASRRWSSTTEAPRSSRTTSTNRRRRTSAQAIRTDTTFNLAHYNLGKVYQKQRKWDKAAEALEAAAELAPKNANYQYDLGEAYLEAKKIDQAEKALKAATEADPELFKAHWRLGLVYKMLDQPKPADDELRAAIEANPRFSKSYVALGYLYLDYDFNKEAAQVFQGCVTAKDDDGECHNGYGLALKNLKQYEQATGEFKKAIDLNPELYDALYNCGMAFADWYDERHGNEQKDRAREYLPKVRDQRRKVGRRQLCEGRERQALRAVGALEPRRLTVFDGWNPRKGSQALPGIFPDISAYLAPRNESDPGPAVQDPGRFWCFVPTSRRAIRRHQFSTRFRTVTSRRPFGPPQRIR